jgi:hypothetical protein
MSGRYGTRTDSQGLYPLSVLISGRDAPELTSLAVADNCHISLFMRVNPPKCALINEPSNTLAAQLYLKLIDIQGERALKAWLLIQVWLTAVTDSETESKT